MKKDRGLVNDRYRDGTSGSEISTGLCCKHIQALLACNQRSEAMISMSVTYIISHQIGLRPQIYIALRR